MGFIRALPWVAAVTLALVSSTELAFCDVQIGSARVREEAGMASGGYIPPNEHDHGVYRPLMQGKSGALISVGTFRVLERAAMGDFSFVVMLDYDSVTTQFNEENLKLIAESADRLEYLQKLFSRKAPAELLARARSGQISAAVFFQQLIQNGERVQAEAGSSVARIQHILSAGAGLRDPGAERDITLLERLDGEVRKAVGHASRAQNSLFGSDEIFTKVRKRVLRNEVIAIGGDLAGTKSMSDLAAALKTNKTHVSVVDLSNSIDHIQMASPYRSTPIKRLVANLRRLPLAQDALILFTERPLITANFSPKINNWEFYALGASQFFEAAGRGFMNNRASYMQYLEKVHQNRAPRLDAEGYLITPAEGFGVTESPSPLSWCRSFMERLLSTGAKKIVR